MLKEAYDHIYASGWTTILLFMLGTFMLLAYLLTMRYVYKKNILNRWYLMIAFYFFVISCLEIYAYEHVLKVYEINAFLGTNRNLAVVLLSALCALILLLSVYFVPFITDIIYRTKSKAKLAGLKAFMSALFFLLMKYTYYITAVSSAGEMNQSLSNLIYLYYLVMCIAVFLNVFIFEMNDVDRVFLADILNRKSEIVKAQYISSIYFLLNTGLILILGVYAYTIQQAPILAGYPCINMAYFLTIISYLHLIYYRSYHITLFEQIFDEKVHIG